MNPNRQKLIAALRAELPEKFEWDFGITLRKIENCGSIGCAIGLATLIFSGKKINIFDDDEIANFFDLDDEHVRLFLSPIYYNHGDYAAITPAMVADALEAAPERNKEDAA